MSLARLFLILFLLAFGVLGLGWLTFDARVVPAFALISGVLYILEGLGVWSYSTPSVRRHRDTA